MTQGRFRIFVSSEQDEFAEERRRLKAWLTKDLFLSRFVENVFLFEDVPSRGHCPRDVYLDEVKNADIYIGLVGSQYYGKTSFQAPMRFETRFELPREAVEEALVNALVHRDWRLSASVEVRLFADRVEIWNPGALPEGITISKLYETHSSYPVNELVLKVFDFAGIIESLGTGIGRMIDACRKSGLPDPTWEQRGSSFVVTIWKDMWTEARLSELGLTERQKQAVRALKMSRQMAASDYMALTGVARNTATRDLQKLVSLKVFAPSGKGKHTIYSLNRLCTIYAPYAPSSVKPSDNSVFSAFDRGNGDINASSNEGLKGKKPQNEGINEGLKFDVFRLILENPGCRVPFFIERLAISRATAERTIAALIAVGKVEHRCSKKTGGYYVKEGR